MLRSGYIFAMILILLVIHIMVAFALIGVVLLQKSEGGALGIGGGGMAGFMTGRSTANLLTRATAILAAAFMTTSVLLVVMHNRVRSPASIIDQGAPAAPARPVVPRSPATPSVPAPAPSPAKPAAPTPMMPKVPLAH